MAGELTAAVIDAALKELYAGQAIKSLVYDKAGRVGLSTVKSFTEFAGKKMPFPILYQDAGVAVKDFATAQTNATAPKFESWDMDVVQTHTTADITAEALLRSRNDRGSFLAGLKMNIDSAINQNANRIESMFFRSRVGTVGTISAIASSVITLTDKADITNFHIGQTLVFAADATSALRDSGTSATVTVVNRVDGKVTISATPTGVTTSDLIFNKSDYTGANDTLRMAGLEDWLPATAQSSFFGVDRTVDSRLCPGRISGSLSDIEASILEASAYLQREGSYSAAPPNMVALVSPETLRLLIMEMGAKVTRDAGGKATGGFRQVEIDSALGVTQVRSARYCQNNRIWMLNVPDWQVISMKEIAHIAEEDGLKIQRAATADQFQVRIRTWSNVVCQTPTNSLCVTLA